MVEVGLSFHHWELVVDLNFWSPDLETSVTLVVVCCESTPSRYFRYQAVVLPGLKWVGSARVVVELVEEGEWVALFVVYGLGGWVGLGGWAGLYGLCLYGSDGGTALETVGYGVGAPSAVLEGPAIEFVGFFLSIRISTKNHSLLLRVNWNKIRNTCTSQYSPQA